MRMMLALSTFFKILFDAQAAQSIKQALTASLGVDDPPAVEASTSKPDTATSQQPGRSEAIALLATLQREARFVDIVSEPLTEYSDEQVGAAARDVLRDCGQVLQRLFDLQPIANEDEGHDVEAPANYDPHEYRLVGQRSDEPPFLGQLVHHGWRASRCELPQWSGGPKSALVVAPVEIEMS